MLSRWRLRIIFDPETGEFEVFLGTWWVSLLLAVQLILLCAAATWL